MVFAWMCFEAAGLCRSAKEAIWQGPRYKNRDECLAYDSETSNNEAWSWD